MKAATVARINLFARCRQGSSSHIIESSRVLRFSLGMMAFASQFKGRNQLCVFSDTTDGIIP